MEANMRQTRDGLVVVAALVLTCLASPAQAQATKSARGTVSAMSGQTLTVTAGGKDLVFAVDAKTVLTASGAGTAQRRAETPGSGPKLADFVKVGDAVTVSYQEQAGGALHATNVTKVRSAGAAGGSTSEDRSMTATGTVSALTGTQLTINGTGSGGSKFTQSYSVSGETRVVATGAGTAAAAGGGKVTFADQVHVGDQVVVTYRPAGTELHAERVQVMVKKR
jgi:hypothetical protein